MVEEKRPSLVAVDRVTIRVARSCCCCVAPRDMTNNCHSKRAGVMAAAQLEQAGLMAAAQLFYYCYSSALG
jgi:hypothetical protein